MRVALTYPDINRMGGVERVVVECAHHLAASGHEVTVYASRWDHSVLEPSIGRVHVPVRRRPEALAAVGYRRGATARLRAASPPADVHASFSALSPLGGVFWTPSVHAAAVEQALGRRGIAGRLVQRLNPYHAVRLRLEAQVYAPGGARRVIAQTETVKADAVRLYAADPDRIDVLPLGFDRAAYSPARRRERRAQAREALGVRASDRVVLFVANELERKGFDTLVEAVGRLNDPDVRLHVVGRVAPGAYQRRIDALGLADRVHFLGATDDVAHHHAAADVFALPTRYEPWGLVIVEALASGLPVVTSRLAGAAEVIEEGATGWLLDDPDDAQAVADGIRWALDGRARPDEDIAESVRQLEWPEVLGRWERILREEAVT